MTIESEAIAWDEYVAAFTSCMARDIDYYDQKKCGVSDLASKAARYADIQILERRKRFSEFGMRHENRLGVFRQIDIEQDLADLYGWDGFLT